MVVFEIQMMMQSHISDENSKITTVEPKWKQYRNENGKKSSLFNILFKNWKTQRRKKEAINKRKKIHIEQYCTGNMHKLVVKYVYCVVTSIFCLILAHSYRNKQFFYLLSLASGKKKWIFISRKMLLMSLTCIEFVSKVLCVLKILKLL